MSKESELIYEKSFEGFKARLDGALKGKLISGIVRTIDVARATSTDLRITKKYLARMNDDASQNVNGKMAHGTHQGPTHWVFLPGD